MEDDIAIIGVGIRFPGNATSAQELWRILAEGESQWSAFPSDRLNIDGYFHPSGNRQGSISFRGAHFLKGDISAFDASFFSITTEEAAAIDPQQRMLLEVTYEALENAGLKKEDVEGSETSVYMGSFVKDYEQICLRDSDWSPKYAATGNGPAIMSNRISYAFNFHGPSITVDTGCSGSLVSVDLAVRSLQNQDVSMAIAGGVGLILTPSTIMPMTALNFLSPDGKCYTFDSRANGYGRGEGVGIVVMKRLCDALLDQDPIRAVIRGSRVNQDGRTTGITLPSKEAQVANILAVYRNAGLPLHQTAYVECHGTGTQAGDWRELKAISETFASGRQANNPVVVGSLKPNIGHLEGAAGIAGLIKGVLMLEHGQIPPNINFEKGNPNIDFHDWKVKVPRKLLDWPQPGLRRISVNCFGFGGTNAHLIIDEAPIRLGNADLSPQIQATSRGMISNGGTGKQQTTPQLICFSTHVRAGIARTIASHAQHLRICQNSSPDIYLSNYAYTLGCRRSKLEWKAFMVAETKSELVSKLEAFDPNSIQRSTSQQNVRVTYLFGGQGTQWAQMGKDLMRFRKFRASIWDASNYLRIRLGSSYDLFEELMRCEDTSNLSKPNISQPATTALQIALVELLSDFNVHPSYVVGHSSGEIAAAFAAGALSREEAWEVAYYRGLATFTISVLAPKLKGGMIVVGMSQDEAELYLRSTTLSVQVACINSSRLTTLSGDYDSIQHIANYLTRTKIFHRILRVDIAYHSSHMKLIESDYKALIRHISPRHFHPGVKMFSSLTGREISGKDLNASYWSKNLVSPVQYLAAMETMMRLDADELPNVLLELSPRATLRSPTSDIMAECAPEGIVFHPLVEPKARESAILLQAIGDLWCRGVNINMDAVMAPSCERRVSECLTDLPPYQWSHEASYWHESHLDEAIRFREYPRQDLVGAPTPDSTPFHSRWRGFIRISENPWIQQHQIQKTIVYPAAGMVCMVLEAAKQLAAKSGGVFGYEILDMKIEKAIIVPDTSHGLEATLHIDVRPDSETADDFKTPREFSIFSKPLDKPWERHVTGVLRFHPCMKDQNLESKFCLAQYKELSRRCNDSLIPRQLYEFLDVVGINYGPLFQNITKIRKQGNSCVSEIQVPDTSSSMPGKFEYPHIIHPATLDSMLQTLFAIKPVPMVPTYIKSIFFSSGHCSGISAHSLLYNGYATATELGSLGAEGAFFMMQDKSESSWIQASGLRFINVPDTSTSFLPNHHNLCSEIVWKEDLLSVDPKNLTQLIECYAHKHPALQILQVGGSLSLATAILDIVTPDLGVTPSLMRFTIATEDNEDASDSVLSLVKSSPLQPFVETRAIDALGDVLGYHLVVAAKNTKTSNEELEKFLLKGGRILREIPSVHPDRVSTDEMSCHAMDDATNGIMKHESSTWTSVQGFHVHQALQALPGPDGCSHQIALIVSNDSGAYMSSFKTHLRDFLKCGNGENDLVVLSTKNVLSNPSVLVGRIAVSLLDIVGKDSGYFYHLDQQSFDELKILYDTAKAIVWITRGANMKPRNPKSAPVIALARTLMSENPLKKFITVDLALDEALDDILVAKNVASILLYTMQSTTSLDPQDMEFSVQGDRVFIPRLRPLRPLNELVEGKVVSRASLQSLSDLRQSREIDTCLRLQVPKLGSKDYAHSFAKFSSTELGPDDVEVLFEIACLGRGDLESFLGRSIHPNIGLDLCGRIGRIGAQVTKFSPGDKVVALAPEGALMDPCHLDTRLVRKCEAGLIPSLHISAYYGLIYLGRVSVGRKILIHRGASAAGLAAVDVGLIAGAEIFATVIGPHSERQKEVLVSKGLAIDHILDANSEHFVELLQSLTGGKGVDVVYNHLRDYVETDSRCVRKCGSIIHFADYSIDAVPPKIPSGSATVVCIDLQQLLADEIDFVSELFDLTLEFVSGHSIDFLASASVRRDFDLQNLEAAFKHLEETPDIGYVMVSVLPPLSDGLFVLDRPSTKSLVDMLDTEGTYVLVGGLGGLGRSISELLIGHGARHLAFISRSGAANSVLQNWLSGLVDRGINARVYAGDICDANIVKSQVEAISVEMPPIRGVFQCAAVIKDAVFDNMTWSDWSTAFRPKTIGSQNLVESISAVAQDPFFIFLSSSAGVIGNRGQANYAAGNWFQDAMARSLREEGKHAISIDLGPVLGAGMLSEDEATLNMLRASGFYGIRHEDFLRIVTHAITMEIQPGVPMPPQVILGVGTGGLFHQNKPADPYWFSTAMYSYLNLVDMPLPDLGSAATSSMQNKGMKSRLACCTDVASAVDLITSGLVQLLAKSLTLLPEEIDANKAPAAYGVDSLVAVGIRNWVLGNCGVQISVFEVLGDVSVTELSKTIAARADTEYNSRSQTGGGRGVERS